MKRTAAAITALVLCSIAYACGANSGATLELNEPRGIDVDSQDRIVVAYTASHVVAVYSPEGELVRLLGRLGEPGSDDAHFNTPYGVTVDVGDSIYVADTENDRLCIFDENGLFVRAIGDADGPGALNKPRGCELDEDGNILVADGANNRIQKISPQGEFIATFGVFSRAASTSRLTASISTPSSLSTSPTSPRSCWSRASSICSTSHWLW